MSTFVPSDWSYVDLAERRLSPLCHYTRCPHRHMGSWKQRSGGSLLSETQSIIGLYVSASLVLRSLVPSTSVRWKQTTHPFLSSLLTSLAASNSISILRGEYGDCRGGRGGGQGMNLASGSWNTRHKSPPEGPYCVRSRAGAFSKLIYLSAECTHLSCIHQPL